MEFTPPFGRWLKQRRQALDLTQEELARRIGYASETLRKFESGGRHPTQQAAEFLAEHLHIPASDREVFITFARGAEYLRWRLPQPTTSLVGRVLDAQLARKLLTQEDVRLLNLMGPPGVGKTRLALQVARQASESFPDGVCFVGLAPIADPAQVGPVIAETLQIRHMYDHAVEEALAGYLSDKQFLLLLDNFEHLTPAAPVVAELLARAPGLKVLVTSRAMLHLNGEHVFEVAPLATPAPGLRPVVHSLLDYPAVELFVQRARQAKPTFTFSESNASAVAELCRNLDGVPLAIELAAARVRAFTPQTILRRLDHHAGAKLRFLDSGARDLPPRQRTLHATIDWSYDLLSHDEQAVFRQLGVFVGGWTLEAAEGVCDPGIATGRSQVTFPTMENQVARLLESLVEKSLVQEVEDRAGDGRYGMLETIREYALDRLEASGEADAVRRRHVRYFAQMCNMDDNYPGSPVELTGYLKAYAREGDNLYVALGWSKGYDDEPLLHLLISRIVGWLVNVGGWYMGFHGDASAITAETFWSLERNPGISPELRSRSLRVLGLLLINLGDFDRAARICTEALEISLATGLLGAAASAAHVSGWNAYGAGDLALAVHFFTQQLELGEEYNSPGWVLNGLSMLGHLAIEQKDFDRADELLQRALAMARSLGIKVDLFGGQAWVLHDMGLLAYEQGDYAKAYDFGSQALLLYEEEGIMVRCYNQHIYLGRIALALQQVKLARQHLGEMVRLARANAYQPRIALAQLAQLAALQGDRERYALLMGAASRWLLPKPVWGDKIIHEYHRCWTAVAEASYHLSEPAFAAAWAEGEAMTLWQAVEYALAG